jgi:probable HAF family extracellular repeat protein
MASIVVAAALSAETSAAATYAVTDLGTLDGVSSMGKAISESGLVVGDVVMPGELSWRAFLYDGVMHDLGTLGGMSSSATGVNDAGDVVGESTWVPGSYAGYRGFLYRDGVMTDLVPDVPVPVIPFDINDAGDVVGLAVTLDETAQQAFVLREGTLTYLGTLGGTNSVARAITQSGEIAGQSLIEDDVESHAFLVQGGAMQDLGTLGNTNASAWGISDALHVVGWGNMPDTGDNRAFLYHGGVMAPLPPLELNGTSRAFDVNTAGHVVGHGRVGGQQRAFIYRDGVTTDLNTLIPADSDIVVFDAMGINDAGQIVGTANVGDEYHAVLLTPNCGNGVVDDGEECDEGGTNGNGSCCTAACLFAEEDSPCAGGVCTAAGVCVPPLGCGSAPVEGCQPAASRKARLTLGGGKLAYVWKSSATVAPPDFGNPAGGTDYLLCIYHAGGLVTAATMPAGGQCGGKPCWKAAGARWRYRAAAGASKLSLAPGAAGKSTIRANVRGVAGLPASPLGLPVRVQVRRDGGSACWEAEFTSTKRNTGAKFSATSE